MAETRITVVIDREDRTHPQFWTEILEVLHNRGIETKLTLASLADHMAAPLEEGKKILIETIEKDTDVLILNWDVVNGDPDFGGDVALRWFEHRQFALRGWLNRGGLLIIEGQATQGVPDDRYYSAVLGEGEVRVSAREDPRDPEAEKRRMVGNCRMTRLGKKARGFEGLDDICSYQPLKFDDIFPPKTAGRLVPTYLHAIDTASLLYRGWFRRRTPGKTLTWVPYVRRDRPWPRDYPTLLVAKCENKGAVVATTIMLSATRQVQLIQALLYMHGQVDKLPEPGAFRRFLGRYVGKAFAGLMTGLLLLFFGPSDGVRKLLVAAGVGLVVTIALDVLPAALRSSYRAVRWFTGA